MRKKVKIDLIAEGLADLAKLSEQQLDSQIALELLDVKNLPVQERPLRLKFILDKCAYESLASDTCMVLLDLLWKLSIKEALRNYEISLFRTTL